MRIWTCWFWHKPSQTSFIDSWYYLDRWSVISLVCNTFVLPRQWTLPYCLNALNKDVSLAVIPQWSSQSTTHHIPATSYDLVNIRTTNILFSSVLDKEKNPFMIYWHIFQNLFFFVLLKRNNQHFFNIIFFIVLSG